MNQRLNLHQHHFIMIYYYLTNSKKAWLLILILHKSRFFLIVLLKFKNIAVISFHLYCIVDLTNSSSSNTDISSYNGREAV